MSLDINLTNVESTTNKSTNVNTDQASNTKYPSVKAVFDWAVNLLSGKVDKVTGKGLSTEDYTTAEKSKLAGIEAGAEVNVNADWNAISGDAQILNKPTIPSITGLVPYTGATADVDLGNNDLNAEGIKIKGTAGNGHLNLKHQSSASTAGGSESVLYADNTGNPKWKNDGNAVQAVMLENSAITGATKTKITYDAKGLVTAGSDATTADIADSSNKRYVTDAQLTVLGNTSGTNTGDETQSSILSKLGVFYLPFTPSSIVTGTTSETQVAVVTIPPNSIKSVDNLKIYTPVVKTGTTGLCTVTYKLSTSPTMPSGTTDRIAFVAGTTGSQWIGMNRNPSYNSGNLIIAQTTTSLISDLTTAAQAPSVVAKDNSVTLYLYVSITLGNSSDSAYLSGGYITNN